MNACLRGRRLLGNNNDALLNKVGVDLVDQVANLVERAGDVSAGLLKSTDLSIGRLEIGMSTCASVTELDLRGEHLRASAQAPGHHRLVDGAILESLADLVFLVTTNLTEQHHHLDTRVSLESQQMVHEGGARVTIATDGNTLVYTVGVARNDVVKLIGETARTRYVGNASWTVELAGQNVVKTASRITYIQYVNDNVTPESLAGKHLPIRKQPGLIPPTVAGPMMVTGPPCSAGLSVASLMSCSVRLSGTPSAMMAMVLMLGMASASLVDS